MENNPTSICKLCSSSYDVKEVYRHFGSDHRQTCWKCLKEWIETCENDPYRVGAGILKNERPHFVDASYVARFKEAYEATSALLKESK